jgi:hypothetical protein
MGLSKHHTRNIIELTRFCKINFAFVETQLEQKFEMSKLRIMHAYIGMQFLYLSLGICDVLVVICTRSLH